MEPLSIFIGYDSREPTAWEVCRRSLVKHASVPLHIQPLNLRALEHAGLYSRTWHVHGGRFHDDRDRTPFSTEFKYTRFLVPALTQWRGWALFCDGDFLWRADVAELFALKDERRALMCVQHRHEPDEGEKKRGDAQISYHRKNWSSMMLLRCDHPANRALTPYKVSKLPAQWLHALSWCDESEIGALPLEWNWLAGISDPSVAPKAVHFTRGTPDMPGRADEPFAAEWRAYA